MNSKSDVLKTLGSILDDEQGKLKLSNAQSYEDIYKLYKDYEGKLNIDDFKEEFDKFVCSRINKAGLSEDNLQTVSGGKGSKVTSALMAGLATISSAGMGASAGHFVSSPVSSKQMIEKSKSFVKTHPWITTSVGVGVPTTLGLGALALYLLTHSEGGEPPKPDSGHGGNGGNNPGYKKDEYNEKFWFKRKDGDKKLTYTKGNHYRAFNKDYDISSFTLSADSEENAIIEYFKGHEAAAKRLSFAELNIVEFKAQGGVQDGKLAIVNAANANLGDGSGCCADVYRADQFAEEEASKWKHETGLNGLNTGDAMIQRATGLRGNGISYIIQALGPDLRGKSLPIDETIKKQLVSAYVNSVELAAAHGCTAVAFPSISTGIFKYPENEASSLAVQAVIRALEQQTDARGLKVCLSTYKINSGDSSMLAKFANAHEQFMKSQNENSPGNSGEGVVTGKKDDKDKSKDQNPEGSKAPDEKSDDVQPINRSSSPSPAPSPDLPSKEPPKDETIPVQAVPVAAAETNATAEPQVVAEPIVEEPHQENEQDSGIAAPAAEIQAPVVNAVPPEVAQPVVQKNQPSVEKPNPTSTASKPPQSSSSSAGAAASRTPTESSKKEQAPEPPSAKPQGGNPESEINTTSSDKAQKHKFPLSLSLPSFTNPFSKDKSTSDRKKEKKDDDKKASKASSTGVIGFLKGIFN